MPRVTYAPTQKVNIGIGKDDVNDFARKYNLEIEAVYDILNRHNARAVVFYDTSDYWSQTETGYKLSLPHNGNVVFAVYRTDSASESTQVLTGVKTDDTNVEVESVEKFNGFLLYGAMNPEKGIGYNTEDWIVDVITEIKDAAEAAATTATDEAEFVIDAIDHFMDDTGLATYQGQQEITEAINALGVKVLHVKANADTCKQAAQTSATAAQNASDYASRALTAVMGASAAPVGTVLAYAGSTAPDEWLVCDGSAVSRTTYADLFDVIGTTYGAGDGSTTFNLPDLSDKFVEGSGTNDVGDVLSAGLPNITGSFNPFAQNYSSMSGSTFTGAFEVEDSTQHGYSSSSTDNDNVLVTFDASESNSIYGNSDTVQPPAVAMLYIIKWKAYVPDSDPIPIVDPTLTISGAAADAKVVGDALSVTPINATISTSFTDGKTLVSTTGVIEDYSGRSVSDVIETINATTLKITNASTNMRSVVFYDSAQNWLAGLNEAMLGDGDYAIPSGTVYMRYCALTASISDIVLELRNIPTVVSTIYDSIDKRAKSYDWQSKRYVSDEIPIQKVYGVTKFPNNIVDISECVDNEYVVYNTGVFKAGTSYFRTGYLPVTAGVTYKSNVGRNAAWYTSGKVYISGVSGTSIQSGITAPVNSVYLAFSINKSSDGITNPADLYCASATNYGTTKTQINNLAEWCSGKKINWIGDSIVDGNDFDEEVCNALGLIKQYEYGINGSTISLNGDGTDGRNALCIRYTNMTDDADIIAVSCGTNDWMYAWAPIGDINSSSNATFYGALKTLCEGLINKYPQKVIFFTTPIKRGQAFSGGDGGEYTPDGVMTTPFSKNKYGKTLGDYADIIKEICGYYSIPVLDMYRESLLNPHIASQQDLFDTALTHPNTTGQKIMARRVAGWLTQLGYIIP